MKRNMPTFNYFENNVIILLNTSKAHNDLKFGKEMKMFMFVDTALHPFFNIN